MLTVTQRTSSGAPTVFRMLMAVLLMAFLMPATLSVAREKNKNTVEIHVHVVDPCLVKLLHQRRPDTINIPETIEKLKGRNPATVTEVVDDIRKIIGLGNSQNRLKIYNLLTNLCPLKLDALLIR